ncbi:MAG: hypothetical protein ABL967_04125 [Bryobacteraceae bacterium]
MLKSSFTILNLLINEFVSVECAYVRVFHLVESDFVSRTSRYVVPDYGLAGMYVVENL